MAATNGGREVFRTQFTSELHRTRLAFRGPMSADTILAVLRNQTVASLSEVVGHIGRPRQQASFAGCRPRRPPRSPSDASAVGPSPSMSGRRADRFRPPWPRRPRPYCGASGTGSISGASDAFAVDGRQPRGGRRHQGRHSIRRPRPKRLRRVDRMARVRDYDARENRWVVERVWPPPTRGSPGNAAGCVKEGRRRRRAR